MKIQRYKTQDMRSAMQRIQKDHGADAVIISQQQVEGAVVVIAAVDYDEVLYQQLLGDNTNPLWLDAYCQKHGVDVDAGIVTISVVDQPAGASNDELDLMRQELLAMRDSLEQHMMSATNNQITLQYPHLARVLLQLRRMGFSEVLSQRLACAISDTVDESQQLTTALRKMRDIIPLLSPINQQVFDGDMSKAMTGLPNSLPVPPAIMAFVGPTGVGKTTGLAKVAAHLLLGGSSVTAQNIAFICCDSCRIGAFEQLNVFGKILGVAVYRASNRRELEQQLDRLHNKQHILIDSEGFCKRQTKLPEALSMLSDTPQDINNYLVLSADMQRAMMDEAYRLYQPLNPQAVVLTKLDQALELGTAISSLVDNHLPLAYVSNGQEVPDSLSAASSGQLINLCLNLIKAHESMQPGAGEDKESVFSAAV